MQKADTTGLVVSGNASGRAGGNSEHLSVVDENSVPGVCRHPAQQRPGLQDATV